jgi:hypothetical protein
MWRRKSSIHKVRREPEHAARPEHGRNNLKDRFDPAGPCSPERRDRHLGSHKKAVADFRAHDTLRTSPTKAARQMTHLPPLQFVPRARVMAPLASWHPNRVVPSNAISRHDFPLSNFSASDTPSPCSPLFGRSGSPQQSQNLLRMHARNRSPADVGERHQEEEPQHEDEENNAKAVPDDILNPGEAVEVEEAEQEQEASMDAESDGAGTGPERWNKMKPAGKVRIDEVDDYQPTGERHEEMEMSNADMEISIVKQICPEACVAESGMTSRHYETRSREYSFGNSAMQLSSSSTLERVMAGRRDRLGIRNDPLNWPRRILSGAVSTTKENANTAVHMRPNRLRKTRRYVFEDSDDELPVHGQSARAREGQGQGDDDEYAPGEDEDEFSEAEESTALLWSKYLRDKLRREPEFLTSAEARMETVAGQASQAASSLSRSGVEEGQGINLLEGSRIRCLPYSGLEITNDNCPDLRYVYEQEYEIQVRRGGSLDGFRQFRTLSGQLARFSVAVKVAQAESFPFPGGLFQLTVSSDLIRAFVGGFQAQAQAATVYAKVILLGRLCRMAKQHFGKVVGVRTASVLSRIDETRNLLGGFSRVEKATSRRQTAVRRDQNHGTSFIRTSDWYKLQRFVEEDMYAVNMGVTELSRKYSNQEMEEYLDETPSFIRKFSLLLVVYILLVGSGQRPQAYWSLQYPKSCDIARWKRDNERSDHWQRSFQEGGNDDREVSTSQCLQLDSVKLYPAKEKTPRDTLHPGIIFPDDARKFFTNHVTHIRPAIMRRAGRAIEDAADVDRTFLVHSETGRALSGENLRSTLRTYVCGIQGLSGDLSRVTVMTVRASFATVMFRAYRNGKFPGQTTEQFLGELAEVMNTSTEMLRTTYIKTNGTEFDEAARTFLGAARDDDLMGSLSVGNRNSFRNV